jgi:hypothetical protein
MNGRFTIYEAYPITREVLRYGPDRLTPGWSG